MLLHFAAEVEGDAWMIVEARKRCPTCKECKPLSAFNKNCLGTYGVQSHCRECEKETARRRRREDPDYAAAKRFSNLTWRKKPHAKTLKNDSNRRCNYGLSREEFDAFMAVPICQVPGCAYVFKHDGDLCFDHDHDHEDGHVRGVVCVRHNQAMMSKKKTGMEPIANLLAMVEYLQRDRERTSEQG